MNFFEALNPLVWPLTFLLVAVLIIGKLGNELRPLAKAIIDGMTRDATRNSKAYATAIAFGVSASLSAWVDAFKDLTAAQSVEMSYWQLSAIFARIANPFIVAMLAYAYRNGHNATSQTTPPFQPPSA